MSATLTINNTLTLPVSGRYATPANDNDVLPIVYGAMVGAWVAPCINSTTFVYCIASHGCLSESNGNVITVEDDDGTRTDGTFFEAYDYEGQGAIAYIQLGTAANGSLLVSCQGKVDSGGALIENPVDIVLDLVGETDVDIDSTAIAQARRDADSEGYTASGIILKEQPFTFWLTAIMGSFLGDWWTNNAGQLKLRFGVSSVGALQIAGFLAERKTTQVQGLLSIKNIVNQAILNYQLSFAAQDKRFKEGVKSNYLRSEDGESSKDSFSQVNYGIRKRIFELDWIQSAIVAGIVQEKIIEKFAEKTWIISWTEYDFLNIHIEEGDYVAFSWEERRDEDGNALINEIGQVMSKDVDLDAERITFELRDLGLVLVGTPDIWDGNQSTGDGGLFGGDRDTRRLV